MREWEEVGVGAVVAVAVAVAVEVLVLVVVPVAVAVLLLLAATAEAARSGPKPYVRKELLEELGCAVCIEPGPKPEQEPARPAGPAK